MTFDTKKHEPLKQRYNIVFFALICSVFVTIYNGQDLFSYFNYYIFLVAFFDQILRIIPAACVCEKRLLAAHQITYWQLENYYQSKRFFRAIGVGIASTVSIIAFYIDYPFEVIFPVTYASVWLFYPLARKYVFKIPAPKIFQLIQEEFKKREGTQHHKFDDRSYDPLKLGTLGWQVNRTQDFISLHAQRKTDLR